MNRVRVDSNTRATAWRQFACDADFAVCRAIHRRHGTTYYFATQRLPSHQRRRIHALYGFVRVPDEWVDNPGELSADDRCHRLQQWRNDLLRGIDGVEPSHPVMRAFCDVARESRVPLEEPLLFLDAMCQDLSVARYETYEDLRGYMRGSASAVGVMTCHMLEAPTDQETVTAAKALGEAMQLTNFLRDVREDADRGRIYLPLEDLATFDVQVEEIQNGVFTDRFANLMKFEIERARALYRVADTGIPSIPPQSRRGVRLARILYARILDRIEAQGYDVFAARARTSKLEKLATAARVLLQPA